MTGPVPGLSACVCRFGAAAADAAGDAAGDGGDRFAVMVMDSRGGTTGSGLHVFALLPEEWAALLPHIEAACALAKRPGAPVDCAEEGSGNEHF